MHRADLGTLTRQVVQNSVQPIHRHIRQPEAVAAHHVRSCPTLLCHLLICCPGADDRHRACRKQHSLRRISMYKHITQ